MKRPGYQSDLDLPVTKEVRADRTVRRFIVDMGRLLREYPSIRIWDVDFRPCEYINAVVQQELIWLFRNKCVKNTKSPHYQINRPTVILKNWNTILQTFGELEFHWNIDIPSIARDVLFSEFCGKQGFVGETFDYVENISSIPDEGWSGYTISAWYCVQFSKDLAAEGIVYNAQRRMFQTVRRGALTGLTGAVRKLQNYTDTHELQALCKLMGPYGLRIFEAGLLKIVYLCVETVKTALMTGAEHLKRLQTGFVSWQIWKKEVYAMKNLSQVVKKITILGCVLHLRDLILAAHESVMKETAPFMHNVISLAHQHMQSTRSIIDTDQEAFGIMLRDAGVKSDVGDSALRRILKSFIVSDRDRELWNYLPELFGIVFVSHQWTSCQYDINLQGHTNNAHCMALAISNLLVGFQTFQAPSAIKKTPQDIEAKVVKVFHRFVDCASYSMLHMAASRNYQSSIQSIMVFLEAAVHASNNRVDMAYLEECFPFTLIRYSFISLYQGQSRARENHTAEEDD